MNENQDEHWIQTFKLANQPQGAFTTPLRLNIYMQDAVFPFGISVKYRGDPNNLQHYVLPIALSREKLWEAAFRSGDERWGPILKQSFMKEMKKTKKKLAAKFNKEAKYTIMAKGPNTNDKGTFDGCMNVRLEVHPDGVPVSDKDGTPRFTIIKGKKTQAPDPLEWLKWRKNKFTGDVMIQLRSAYAIPEKWGFKWCLFRLRPKSKTTTVAVQFADEAEDVAYDGPEEVVEEVTTDEDPRPLPDGAEGDEHASMSHGAGAGRSSFQPLTRAGQGQEQEEEDGALAAQGIPALEGDAESNPDPSAIMDELE